MLKASALDRTSAVVPDAVDAGCLTNDEIRDLHLVMLTAAAERHLIGLGQPCGHHQACRRLAFALWLRNAGRLSEGSE